MAHSTYHGDGGIVPLGRGLGWLIVAAAFSAVAAYAAYAHLGGVDTPAQKAEVVGAALIGLAVVVWTRTIVQVVLYAAVIVGLLWAGNYYWHYGWPQGWPHL